MTGFRYNKACHVYLPYCLNMAYFVYAGLHYQIIITTTVKFSRDSGKQNVHFSKLRISHIVNFHQMAESDNKITFNYSVLQQYLIISHPAAHHL